MNLIAPAHSISSLSSALPITTFKNGRGSVFFKALGHPSLQAQRQAFLQYLHTKKHVTLFDPLGFGEDTAALLGFYPPHLKEVFTLDIEKKGRLICGLKAKLLPELAHTNADLLLVADFQSKKLRPLLQKFAPSACEIIDLSDLKLSDSLLTNTHAYLDPLNFATNFAFFKDADGTHTRLVTANYWHRYGGKETRLACTLLDETGEILAKWTLPLQASEHLIIIESQDIRERFNLGPFTGQLFLHVIGAAGHDIVKYALDVYSDNSEVYGVTHDANAWPSDYFAGLPAPRKDEDVILWIQNSHPLTIPEDTIRLQVMGNEEVGYTLPQSVPPFASLPVSLRHILPHISWPQQIEVKMGRYCVRPRYEVVLRKRRTICHINVEREDLAPDPSWKKVAPQFGKGYLLPCPLLPLQDFEQKLLPTPMSRLYRQASFKVRAYTAQGELIAEKQVGPCSRHHTHVVDINTWLKEETTQGHLELSYDMTASDEVDGWIHALFRYRERKTGHLAETTFGSHLFNHPITYKNEPQAYSGPPPGLSTRLFLRLAPYPVRTFCHLTYPVSEKWNKTSETHLLWMNHKGEKQAEVSVQIPLNGSRLLWIDELFPSYVSQAESSFILIQDATCRLFGYHGTVVPDKAFSLDHMFGF